MFDEAFNYKEENDLDAAFKKVSSVVLLRLSYNYYFLELWLILVIRVNPDCNNDCTLKSCLHLMLSGWSLTKGFTISESWWLSSTSHKALTFENVEWKENIASKRARKNSLCIGDFQF